MSLVDEVIVIGHGPSPTDRGWGERIDRADCVVRMFDCGWQKPADYGVRYDVGVLTMKKRQARWFEHEAGRRPARWWAYDQDGQGVVVPTPEPQTLMDVSDAVADGRGLGGEGLEGRLTLTRGTAAACFAAKVLKPSRLILVGFDEVRRGRFMVRPYPPGCMAQIGRRREAGRIMERLKARPRGGHRTNGHDYGVEARTIAAVCALHGVGLAWAEDVMG